MPQTPGVNGPSLTSIEFTNRARASNSNSMNAVSRVFMHPDGKRLPLEHIHIQDGLETRKKSYDAKSMPRNSLIHTTYNYIKVLVGQLKDMRGLTGLTPENTHQGARYSMKVSQKGHDLLMHNVILYFQSLEDGLPEENGLEPDAHYITLRKNYDRRARYDASKRMVEHLCEKLIDDTASASLKALVNNEHVHDSFAGPLIEEIQKLMQKYEDPTRKPRGRRPRKPKKTRKPPLKNPNRRRDVAELAASKLVVQKGGEVAGQLRKNEKQREATVRTERDAADEKTRRTKKEDQLEKTRDQVERNKKVLKFAEENGVKLNLRVRRVW